MGQIRDWISMAAPSIVRIWFLDRQKSALLPVKEMTVPAIRQQAGRMLPESGSIFGFWQCILIL